MRVTKGLVIKSPWIDLIMSGKKTWEIRGSRATHRGPFALIKSGTGLTYGVADLVDVRGPLAQDELLASEPSTSFLAATYWLASGPTKPPMPG